MAPMNRQQRRSSAKQSGKIPIRSPQPAAAAFFESALSLLRAGQLAEAESTCRQALAIDADHADSLHLMGLLCQVARQYDMAVEWFAQAIRRNPDVADYFFNLATVLQHQGRVDDAIKSYDRGLVWCFSPILPRAGTGSASSCCSRSGAMKPA
jgi:tetratricopeptide (TPR) repeat protein